MSSSGWWFQICIYFHPYLEKWSNLTNIFQLGWNHQLVFQALSFGLSPNGRVSRVRERDWEIFGKFLSHHFFKGLLLLAFRGVEKPLEMKAVPYGLDLWCSFGWGFVFHGMMFHHREGYRVQMVSTYIFVSTPSMKILILMNMVQLGGNHHLCILWVVSFPSHPRRRSNLKGQWYTFEASKQPFIATVCLALKKPSIGKAFVHQTPSTVLPTSMEHPLFGTLCWYIAIHIYS